MKLFQVLDNERPADKDHIPVANSWNRCIYPTFQEAKDYAEKWINMSYDYEDEELPFILNTPYSYNGYGDTIEIVEIDLFQSLRECVQPGYSWNYRWYRFREFLSHLKYIRKAK